MSLRVQPLKTSLHTSISLAPKYRPSGHLTKQYHTRCTTHRHTSFVNHAYRGHRCKRNIAAGYYKKSATGLWTVATVFGIAIGSAIFVSLIKTSPEDKKEEYIHKSRLDVSDLTNPYLVMAPNDPPGRPGTLTPEEERKLRELWAVTMRVFGVEPSRASLEEANGVNTPVPTPASETPVEKDGKKEKKKSRLSVFRRHKGDKDADSTATPGRSTPSDISSLSIAAEDDKFGQTADFKAAIANTPPEELRRAFWSMVKHDHPDALLLRFLRARKWDVEKALVMMISTMHWRLDEMHVDDDIVKNGELAALQTRDGDAKAKKNAEDFLTQLRMGKSYLHGLDNEGRPMCFVRARLHRAGEQTEESLERFTVYTIETARMLLRPPIDTATIVFDMTDFSMANMDYTPVKFMIKCFEANYPESLGTVLVYKAPWVFNAIWTIIRGWLDPVVAGKVHFAKTLDELSHYVPKSQIPSELGGDEKWEYKYPEPIAGENDKMAEEKPREELQGRRADIVKRYEASILEWVHAAEGGKGPEERRRERDAMAEELRQNYWNLDPYVRARTLYDRTGVIQDGGRLDFYGARKELGAPAKLAVETSADDLD